MIISPFRSWSREPSNESTLDICRHILSSFNGINQNSPPLLSFDEDDDFIVFEDKTESSHDHDSTIEKDESIVSFYFSNLFTLPV